MSPALQTRYLGPLIQQDAFTSGKMAFVSGPRQVGKTTLAKSFLKSVENYFNWDVSSFRKNWVRDPARAISARGPGPIVLDEIHKDRRWKSRLKGVFDVQGGHFSILVTGSARLDLYRKGGDSLMGRFLPYRLNPFSVGECDRPPGPEEIFAADRRPAHRWNDLLRLGGFPEPLFSGKETYARRWSRLRLERLVQEDVRDLRGVTDLQTLRVLADLLPERVGSLLSMNSLREDLGVAYGTVRSWIHVLEALYHCILIRPFVGTVRRALTAEPKLYLYDGLQIENESKRLENLTALHLLKSCQYWTDAALGDYNLHFFRTKEKKEIDFVIVKGKKPWLLVECKSNSKTPSPTLIKYAAVFKSPHNFQLVSGGVYKREYPEWKLTVQDYESFFANWC